MKINIFQIDAFTDKIFSGSTSAVCPLENWIDDTIMQNIASQMNLSKTAFIVKKDNNTYEIRWFTPKSEVTLCDHASLASAFVIFNYLETDLEKVNLSSLGCTIEITKEDGLISLYFPANMPTLYDQSNPLFSLSTGIEPLKVLSNKDFIVIYENEKIIKDLKPKVEVLKSLDLRGVCFTALGDDNDFVFRYFAPKLGVDEDLITGSICSQLVPYWSQVLNKKNLKAVQISERRSELICNLIDDRVLLRGKATLFMKGEIIIEERIHPREDQTTKSKLAIAV